MITRVATTPILNRGQGTSISITHNGGSCNAAFVYTHRVLAIAPSAITYGGIPMTQLAYVQGRGAHQIDIWGLINCPSGSQEVVITQTAHDTRAGVVTYAGVNSIETFPNTTNTGVEPFPNDGILPVSVTTTLDNCILIGLAGYGGSNISSVFAGTDTANVSLLDLGGEASAIVESDPLDVGIAGLHTLEVQSGATNQDIYFVVVALASGGGASSNFFPFFNQ